MKHLPTIIVTLLVLLPAIVRAQVKVLKQTSEAALNPNELRIGAASVKITPPVGMPMTGAYAIRMAEGVHDDLYAKAFVIDNGKVKVAVVSCDLLDVPSDLVANVRQLTERKLGIPAGHIFISATHAHTTPVLLSPTAVYNGIAGKGKISEQYYQRLPGLIAQSIVNASATAKPAKLSYGLGHEESISVNRRYFMKDGTVETNPGAGNPLILKPAGPIDPDVGVLYAETLGGQPIFTYVNFAVHLTIASTNNFSADLSFPLSKILAQVKGADMVTLFSAGCSGNIRPVNAESSQTLGGYGDAERIGTVLGGEVIKTYAKTKPLVVNRILTKTTVAKLPLYKFNAAELLKANQIVDRFGKDDFPFMDMVDAFKVVDVADLNGVPFDAEIQAFAFGDHFAIVGLPGEIFTELGLYIKSRSPYSFTMVVELANGNVDYVPDRKAYGEGAYEAVSSRCAPGSGEILAEEAVKLLYKLKTR